MASSAPSRERLLDAAEGLVAQRGFAVSSREIVLAAGCRNNSAITYHFGSRERLFDSVWQRRMSVVNSRRVELMAGLDPAGQEDVHELMRVYVEPLAEEVSARVPSYWARFNQQWQATMPLDYLDVLDKILAAYPQHVPSRKLFQVWQLLGGTLVDVPPKARDLRVALMTRFVITALASWERDVEVGDRTQHSMPEFSAELQQMAVAMLMAPVSDRRLTPR